MWEWFTANSVWILMASALVLTALLFSRERFQRAIAKAAAKTWYKRLQPSVTFVFWAIAGVTLAIIILAVAAITLSREGILAMVTPETIQRWLLKQGLTIVVIIIISCLVYRLLKLAIPWMVLPFCMTLILTAS